MKHTSYSAYQDITCSGRAETLRDKVYAYIQKYPNSTQIDVSRDISESGRKRISELVAEGLIFESGTKKIDRLNYTTYCTSNTIQQDLFA